jgi:hypothetical protein
VTSDEVQVWLDHYAHAWETADAEAVVELFAEDATYQSNIFDDAHRGRVAIGDYWRRATGTQHAVEVQTGRPLIDGERVAVEWWTTLRDGGVELTLPGCLLLRFDGAGQCTSLREYWQIKNGRREPHAGWGE